MTITPFSTPASPLTAATTPDDFTNFLSGVPDDYLRAEGLSAKPVTMGIPLVLKAGTYTYSNGLGNQTFTLKRDTTVYLKPVEAPDLPDIGSPTQKYVPASPGAGDVPNGDGSFTRYPNVAPPAPPQPAAPVRATPRQHTEDRDLPEGLR